MSLLTQQADSLLDEGQRALDAYGNLGLVTASSNVAAVDRAATVSLSHINAFLNSDDGTALDQEDSGRVTALGQMVDDLVAVRNRTYQSRQGNPVAEGLSLIPRDIKVAAGELKGDLQKLLPKSTDLALVLGILVVLLILSRRV